VVIHPEAAHLVEYGRRLHEQGFVAATDGNLSARLAGGEFLATPTGVPKRELSEGLLAHLSAGGEHLSGPLPSSEWPMHRAIYQVRPDVGAVVHAHPPFATALACAGLSLDAPVLSEVEISLGTVPLLPFYLPSTAELARSTSAGLGEGRAALLANHGAVTVGPDVRTAYYRMETLEQAARIHLYAKLLGGARALPSPAVEALRDLGRGYRMAPLPSPACASCPVASGGEAVPLDRERLASLMAEFARLYGGGPFR
jgi:L-fuculose-phosphate aldolase